LNRAISSPQKTAGRPPENSGRRSSNLILEPGRRSARRADARVLRMSETTAPNNQAVPDFRR
jgi:hypothetical protein